MAAISSNAPTSRQRSTCAPARVRCRRTSAQATRPPACSRVRVRNNVDRRGFSVGRNRADKEDASRRSRRCHRAAVARRDAHRTQARKNGSRRASKARRTMSMGGNAGPHAGTILHEHASNSAARRRQHAEPNGEPGDDDATGGAAAIQKTIPALPEDGRQPERYRHRSWRTRVTKTATITTLTRTPVGDRDITALIARKLRTSAKTTTPRPPAATKGD